MRTLDIAIQLANSNHDGRGRFSSGKSLGVPTTDADSYKRASQASPSQTVTTGKTLVIEGNRLEMKTLFPKITDDQIRKLAGDADEFKGGTVRMWGTAIDYENPSEGVDKIEVSFRADGKTMHLDLMDVDPKVQGKSIGSKAFASMLTTAREIGVEKIELLAGCARPINPTYPAMTGYKVWPRMGFDGEIPSMIGASPYPDGDEFKKVCKKDLGFTPKRVSDFYKPGPDREKRIEWWDKNGGQIHMEMDIRPGSKQAEVFLTHFADKMKREKA